jgi:dTDP-4-dehydrorhamnose 3,5-epimerase
MILNIVVPVGVIRFVMYDARTDSGTTGQIQEVLLSPDSYQRLTVPPGVWMAFQGKSAGLSILLNIASIPHDPKEAENLPLKNDTIPYYDFD